MQFQYNLDELKYDLDATYMKLISNLDVHHMKLR